VTEQGRLFSDCSHPQKAIVPEKRGPHHAKQICAKCGKFLGWIAKPETIKRQAENAAILTALSKLTTLHEWERNFVRQLASSRHISPKQQKLLLDLEYRLLTKKKGECL
jgi:hypothetical protein